MFTGIIEATGRITRIEREGSNTHFTVESAISDALKIDQSVSHNGACLTVVAHGPGWHRVTAVEETLRCTNLGNWQTNSLVNLERCMPLNGRLDGHIVQGHVDMLGECLSIEDRNGSWMIVFRYAPDRAHIVVDKGSICVNGVSLTVVDPVADHFSVAIIPYTWEHTNFNKLDTGTRVNLEFDIIGKYVARLMEGRM